MYQSRHVKSLIGIGNNETLGSWVREFKDFLSSDANPGRGRNRQFSYEDLCVLKLVKEMRDQGFKFEDIHASLLNGSRGDVPEFKPNEIEKMHSDQPKAVILKQVAVLQSQVERMAEELVRLQDVEKQNVQFDRQVQDLEHERDRLLKQIDKINEDHRNDIERLAEKSGREYARGFVEGVSQRPSKKDE